MLFGGGYRTVLICSGTELLRVTIAPDGTIVEDLSEEWVSQHCVMSVSDTAHLRRMWTLADYPQFALESHVTEAPPIPLPLVLGPAAQGRGPPRS